MIFGSCLSIFHDSDSTLPTQSLATHWHHQACCFSNPPSSIHDSPLTTQEIPSLNLIDFYEDPDVSNDCCAPFLQLNPLNLHYLMSCLINLIFKSSYFWSILSLVLCQLKAINYNHAFPKKWLTPNFWRTLQGIQCFPGKSCSNWESSVEQIDYFPIVSLTHTHP